MPTAKKMQQVEDLRQCVERATIAISVDYRGLTVSQTQALRRKLRESSVEMKVVKNTLIRLAARQAGREDMLPIVDGPTALVLGYGDIVAPARALTEYIRQARLPMTLRGAYAEGRVLSGDDVTDLATVPPREVLLSRIAGELQSPLVNLMGLLNATLRDLAGLVDARVTQKEGQGES